jgi:O-succinylhomoserine sulfhydrylase
MIPEFEEDALAEAGFDTLAVRAGHHRTNEGEHSEPMFLTSSFAYQSAAQAAARFGGTEPGNIYSRFTNPTVRIFEDRLAALEGGERCIATSSGMAAILAVCLAFLKAGDHVVCSRSVFGTTNVLFDKYMKKFGVDTTFVSLTERADWEAALRPTTRLFFLETPSNPVCEVADIAALAELAHRHDILLAVDNCFCTPALQQPLKLGADLVIHSGNAKLMEEVLGVVRTCGPSLSAFNAWLFLKGLETLRLRMEAHSASALALARWLAEQPQVEKVNYAGLESHPQHALAASQQRAFGGVLSFVVKGGRVGAWAFIDATRIMSITANLGDTKTTITHPATTTHGRVSPEAKALAGISEGLIRIAVGLEALEDLKADCRRGLQAIGG